MAVKAKAKKAAKKAPAKKKVSYECEVCGYRLVEDRECGCTEEHAFICCGNPMKKT